jgi:hypothetical protein
MKIISSNLFLLIVGAVILSCGSSEMLKNENGLREADKKNTDYLLSLVEKCSINSPRTLSANFDIDGFAGSKSFKAGGNIRFNNNPKKAKIVFHDAVFKSPITEIIQDEDVIKFFFPFDKILYIDYAEKINLKSYSDLDLDFDLISDLVYGRIPVIRNFSLVKVLESGTGPGSEDNRFIILENSEYYETISFKLDLPDKIQWMNKDTKEKIEVYFDKPLKGESILFYKSVRIVSSKKDFKIMINFNDVKYNIPLDIENMSKLELSKDVKIVKKN